jgi:uncharacterized damage-inducible protein DinB
VLTQEQFRGWWDHFRAVHGITMRAIEAIPADKIDASPCKDMRTPRYLVGHMYNSMRTLAEGALRGEIDWSEEKDNAVSESLKSRQDLLRFAKESWEIADRAMKSMTDAKLSGLVKTPWGESYPGFVCASIIFEEHLHHRGQLYAYLRQLGVTPPFLWDFENNAAEYRPKLAQQV